MNISHHTIEIETVAGRPSYHDIGKDIRAIVEQGDIKNGQLVITTAHTTCSLYFEEYMHDRNYYGDEYLHVDINNVLDKIAPNMTSEKQYNSPGPEHIEFGLNVNDPNYPPEKWTMLNTAAHIRSSLFGGFSMTVIVREKKLLMGKMGSIYFVDWDLLRQRNRTINLMLMGI